VDAINCQELCISRKLEERKKPIESELGGFSPWNGREIKFKLLSLIAMRFDQIV